MAVRKNLLEHDPYFDSLIRRKSEGVIEALGRVEKGLKEDRNSRDFPWDEPFSFLGMLVYDLEEAEENGYDISPYERIRVECVENVKAFCQKWGKKYLDKVRDFMKFWYADSYAVWIRKLEEMIKSGELVKESPIHMKISCFESRVIKAYGLAGLRAVSIAKEIDMHEIERIVAECDERFRKLLPAIAKTYANVPNLFKGNSPRTWWWHHEARRLHEMYRAQLSPGTPDRDYYT
ncbi:MAG: hypothetical protein HYU39_07505 [Thaumarchaeota archaeon]|nr:hypothetical protein [Nitrososphaerota archaeon]